MHTMHILKSFNRNSEHPKNLFLSYGGCLCFLSLHQVKKSRHGKSSSFFEEPPIQRVDINFTDMSLSRPLLKVDANYLEQLHNLCTCVLESLCYIDMRLLSFYKITNLLTY